MNRLLGSMPLVCSLALPLLHCRRIAGEPSLFGAEGQHRRKPCHRASEQMLKHVQTGSPSRRGNRIAIERILADIEIERGEIAGHEAVECGEDAFVIELRITLSHLPIELEQAMEHKSLEIRDIGKDNPVVTASEGQP